MPDTELPLQITLCLRAGTVYYFVDRSLSSPEPHYFIVVNRDPLGQNTLLLCVATSKIEKALARNAERPDQVVVITHDEYKPFDVTSAIDCTKLFKKTPPEIADKMKRKEIGYFPGDLPKDALRKIRSALLSSDTISAHEKALIFTPEELARGVVVSGLQKPSKIAD